MSDRLSDAELASMREHLRAERERNNRVPTLTWAEVDALLDEAREYRSLQSMIVDDTRAYRGIVPGDALRGLIERDQRIAELEAENDASKQIIEHRLQTMIEMRESMDAREAQLAEMRREVQMMRDREPLEGAWSWVLDLLDRRAIPTTPPEAEEEGRGQAAEGGVMSGRLMTPAEWAETLEHEWPTTVALRRALIEVLRKADKRVAELEATTIGNIHDYAADMQAQDREVIAALEGRIAELEAERDREQEGMRVIIRKRAELAQAREAQLAEFRKELEEALMERAPGDFRREVLCLLGDFAIPTTPPEAEEDNHE